MSGGLGAEETLRSQTAEQVIQSAAADISSGRLDTAITLLGKAARRFPDDARIQYHLGLALSDKGRFGDAVAPLRKATSDPSLGGQAHFLLGADYFESKEYAAAVRELQPVDRSIQRERVLYLLEESNRRQGHLSEAKSAFHELLTSYPDSAWTHYLLGNAYEEQQELEKAVEEYKSALSKDPSVPNAQFAIGYIYWRQHESKQAREWLEKEAARGCHGLALYYLGEIWRTDKAFSQAEAFYRRSLGCDGSNSNAHLRLGMLLEEEKHLRQAAAQLREAIKLAPEAAAAHYHLASVYRSMGHSAEARVEFEKVRTIQAAKDNGVDVTREAKP